MHNPGLTDPQLRQLIAAHLDEDGFFGVPEDIPPEDFLQAAEKAAREDSDPEQAAMVFICKRLKLNDKKMSTEEKKWLKKIAQKSDL